jgi:hypothetical protein
MTEFANFFATINTYQLGGLFTSVHPSERGLQQTVQKLRYAYRVVCLSEKKRDDVWYGLSRGPRWLSIPRGCPWVSVVVRPSMSHDAGF